MHLSAVLVLVALTCSCVSATVLKKRQLDSLNCSYPVLTEVLASFPLDEPTSGESICRESTVNFTVIPSTEYVTRQAEVFRLLSVMCADECLPSVVNLVDKCAQSFRIPLGRACARNNDFQCWQGAIFNNGTGVFEDCSPFFYDDETVCPEYCKESIEEIRASHDCCVNNVFNTTVFGAELASLQVANGTLWDVCMVERIQFCPFPAAFDTDSALSFRIVSVPLMLVQLTILCAMSILMI